MPENPEKPDPDELIARIQAGVTELFNLPVIPKNQELDHHVKEILFCVEKGLVEASPGVLQALKNYTGQDQTWIKEFYEKNQVKSLYWSKNKTCYFVELRGVVDVTVRTYGHDRINTQEFGAPFMCWLTFGHKPYQKEILQEAFVHGWCRTSRFITGYSVFYGVDVQTAEQVERVEFHAGSYYSRG